MYCFCIISSFISMGKNFYFIIRVHSLSFIACWLHHRLTGNIVGNSHGLGVVNSFQSTFSIALSVTSWASWLQCTQNIPTWSSFAAFLLPGISLLPPRNMQMLDWKRPFYSIWFFMLYTYKSTTEKALPNFIQRSPNLFFDLF